MTGEKKFRYRIRLAAEGLTEGTIELTEKEAAANGRRMEALYSDRSVESVAGDYDRAASLARRIANLPLKGAG